MDTHITFSRKAIYYELQTEIQQFQKITGMGKQRTNIITSLSTSLPGVTRRTKRRLRVSVVHAGRIQRPSKRSICCFG